MSSSHFAVSDPATARRLYEAVRAEAGVLAEEGEAEMSLRLVALAGYIGWALPHGLASDAALEGLIRRIGGSLPRVGPAQGARTRTVHVLTEVYAGGGHSRFAWRWIERAGDPVDVVLTGHATEEIPAGLRTAVESVGGTIHVLEQVEPTLLGRVRALAALLASADHVVVHSHPFDPLVFAALECAEPRPPVVFENHADHAYWLGVGWADVVTNHRELGEVFCREWRGVPAERLAIVPVPVDRGGEGLRQRTRDALGIPAQSLVGICVGGKAKLSHHFGVDFVTDVRRVMTENPGLFLIVIGPGEDSPWGTMATEFPDRMHVDGAVGDLAPFYAAADFAFDSSPVSGGTTVLEEAMAGLGTLCLQQPELYHPIWASQSPGLDGHSVVCASVEELSAAVAALIADPVACREWGERSQRSVEQIHAGAGWQAFASNARAAAVAAGPAQPLTTTVEMAPSYLAELWDFTCGTISAPVSRLMGDPYGVGISLEAACGILGGWFGDWPVRVLIDAAWVDQPELVQDLIRITSTTVGPLTVCLPVDPASAERGIQLVLRTIEALGLDQDSCGQIEILGPEEAAADDAIVLPAHGEAVTALARLAARLRRPATAPAV